MIPDCSTLLKLQWRHRMLSRFRLQVFGYVREGDKIKPLVHRNYSGCNKVRDEVEACVVQCDGGTVAYHRWRGVHGILLHRGVSAADDAWGSIDIAEHFATSVPPLYQSPDWCETATVHLPICLCCLIFLAGASHSTKCVASRINKPSWVTCTWTTVNQP